MISGILAILGFIPGLESLVTSVVGAFYNAKVSITTAMIGGNRDVAVSMVNGAVQAGHDRVTGLGVIAGSKLLTWLVIAFAAPFAIFIWKVVVFDIVLGMGSTPAIHGQVADWANTIIVSIFGSATGMGLASIGANYFKNTAATK